MFIRPQNYFFTYGSNKSYFTLDGLTWTNTTTSESINNIADIIYANGYYIIPSGTKVYLTANGSTINSYSTGSSANFTSLIYAKGLYVAISTSSDIWYTSNISISVTQKSNATSFSSGKKITYRNNIFIAVGNDSVDNEDDTSSQWGSIYTSIDGLSWNLRFRADNSVSNFNDVY